MNDEKGLTLAALIRREQDNTGASYADIARRAGLSKAKIGQLAITGAKHQVRAETVKKLAKGLGLPLPVVHRAALTTAGITDDANGRDAHIDLIVSQLTQLNEDLFRVVSAMIDAAVVQQNRNDG